MGVAGFMVGPRCLMGLLAGCIGSAAMMAVMMGNAGGAWDNSKKLCEKIGLKKTDQGNACVVGDTVGDPFKDTSGPAMDILLKLMAMVALLIAPMLDGKDDWEDAWIGIIPLALMLIASGVLMYLDILTWKDPLAKLTLDENTVTHKVPHTVYEDGKHGHRTMSKEGRSLSKQDLYIARAVDEDEAPKPPTI